MNPIFTFVMAVLVYLFIGLFFSDCIYKDEDVKVFVITCWPMILLSYIMLGVSFVIMAVIVFFTTIFYALKKKIIITKKGINK